MVFGKKDPFSSYRSEHLDSPLGVNLNKHTHITNAIFHRWVDLLTVYPGVEVFQFSSRTAVRTEPTEPNAKFSAESRQFAEPNLQFSSEFG
jgi:hypothetical protein